MVAQKLKACSEAYKTEFEYLAITFEELKIEVDKIKKQEIEYRRIISQQEAIILQQKNVTEAIGYEMTHRDAAKDLDVVIDGVT